jgi:hypothetical protein
MAVEGEGAHDAEARLGCVFINYRVVDDPLGAASIYDRLALCFGRDNVFRDCESMAPGEHYPSAIRNALENAAVLVAVIGPRWLTLTDEAAVRLIDRENDWVRQELAYAFRSGIPVLPVLLKDTPANAEMPMVAELPENIRMLATIQAFEISQRRLSVDLERLIASIARIGRVRPVNGGTELSPAQRIFFAMVDALEGMPSLRTEHDRAALINLLPPAIASSVAYSPRRKMHVLNLLSACRDYPDGIASLIRVIRDVDGERCQPLLRLAELATQLPPMIG